MAAASSRATRRGGGTAILLRPNVKYSRIFDLSNYNMDGCIEISGIYLKSQKLYIFTVYRPPSGDPGVFSNVMEELLTKIDNGGRIVIMGDFNIDFADMGSTSSSLLDMFGSFGLRPLFNEPTRAKNCLDNVLVSLDIEINELVVLDVGISDHKGLFTSVVIADYNKIDKDDKKTSIFRPITQEGKFNFHKLIEGVDWDFLSDSGYNIDGKCSMFLGRIQGSFELAFPEKKYLIKENRCHSVSWFDARLSRLRQTLWFLNDFYKRFPSIELKKYISRFRLHYKKAIITAKKSANANLIKNSTNPNRCMWNIINEFRGGLKSDRVPENSGLTPDKFNDFFVDIADGIHNKIGQSANDAIVDLSGKIKVTWGAFHFSEVTYIEVRDLISSLKSKKSKDIYGLSVEVIKGIKDIIVSPLTKLINLIIKEGTYPDSLKRAMVIPIFKKGDPADLNNYRPISLLPVISKIVEKAMSARMARFFEGNKIFTEKQFGFRKGLGTTQAVMDLVNLINNSFERSEYASAVFCDLSKAFDCVPHDLLIKKLQKYNFHPKSLNLIRTYLENRTQYVITNGGTSSSRTIKAGVPQGSILGPLLFIIYINDLPMAEHLAMYQLYADDTTISLSDRLLERVLEESRGAQERAEAWFSANKLLLNTDKTQKVIFTLKNMNGEPRESVRFLGVHLDGGLVWDAHVEETSKKIRRGLFVLRNLSQCVTPSVLKLAYYSLVHSHLHYALLIWGHASQAARVFSLQRRAVRIIFGLGYREDCKRAFISGGILTLPALYIYVNLIHIKLNLGNYTFQSQIHNHHTRCKSDIRGSYRRLRRCQDGPGYWCVHFYNKIPEHIRLMPVTEYTTWIKKLLLQKAYYSYKEFLKDNL